MSTVPMFDEDDEWEDLKRGNGSGIKTYHYGKESTGKNEGSYKKFAPMCYETHPALLIGGYKVYGGSAGFPMVTNADIYVGLDSSMKRAHHYPWNDPPATTSIYFPITDGSAPSDVAEFKKMVTWLGKQIKAGKLVHIGCIGGHGRTGMLLAALVKEVDGTEDAISYVRDNYCHKAVESTTQVNFLNTHYGIKKVDGSRYRNTSNMIMGEVSSSRSHKSKAHELAEKFDKERPTLHAPQKRLQKAQPALPAPTPLTGRGEPPKGPFRAFPSASLVSVWGKGVTLNPTRIDKRDESDNIVVSQEGA